MSAEAYGWRPALGAIVEPGGVRFRVWAPSAPDIRLVIEGPGAAREVDLDHEGDYRAAYVEGLGAGARYRYCVDGRLAPDPCSRSQPDGVHEASEVVLPRHHWTDAGFVPPEREDLVVYEAHVGTWTPAGTFEGAIEDLDRLAELGVNAIEIMPVASFPGRWNWGYDGVALFAPAAVYGGPEGLRAFVDAAHARGLAVILDVVYNHFGPDGNYTGLLSKHYTTPKHKTPWGDAINFDDVGSAEVRRFCRENLLHWLHEYHIDGFRFDATHAIRDGSTAHVLAELSAALEGQGRHGRTPYLFAESHENDVRYLRPLATGGLGFDGVWADDFHHAVRTLLHDESDGYLASYAGTAQELAATIAQGFLFEGQRDPHLGQGRGTKAREQPWRQFVYCIQNHDQVGNRAFGLRLNTTAGSERFLAGTLLFLLLPQTPMLFQGQEFLASTPFLFFTDHNEDLGKLVTEGRRREFAGFRAFQDERTRSHIPDPQAESTFLASRLRLEEAERGAGALAVAFHRELLRLRREDPVLRASRLGRSPLRVRADGNAVVVEIENETGRAVIAANFGGAQDIPVGGGLRTVISSDEARFGGLGRPVTVENGMLALPAHTAVLLRDR